MAIAPSPAQPTPGPRAVPARPDAAPSPAADDDVERLFREHGARVFQAAYRVTGSAMDAEDVLQALFLRLLRREEPPPAGATAGAYLRRAAVNGALDLLRARASAAAVPLEGAGPRLVAKLVAKDGLPTGEPDPESARAALERRLRRALARLDGRAAEMFALRYFEGHGNRDIARLLGTSAGVVAVTLFRTRSRLRRELAGSTGDPS